MKACIDRKKNLLNSNISSMCPHSMLNFSPITAEIDLGVWGIPANFNEFRVLALLLDRRSLSGGQPNIARCLTISWSGTRYIHYWGLLPSNGILPGAKFVLCPSLAFSYIGSVTARHLNSQRQPKFVVLYKEWNYRTFAPHHFQQRAPPIFHRAAITLGFLSYSHHRKALNSLICADVPFRNYSLAHFGHLPTFWSP